MKQGAGGGKEQKMTGTLKEKKKDAVKILHNRYIKGRKKRKESIREERVKTNVAVLIYDLRHQAGLTQREFAKRVKTTASVISRLESADYDGYSVKMLQRIAASMHQRLEMKFVPE